MTSPGKAVMLERPPTYASVDPIGSHSQDGHTIPTSGQDAGLQQWELVAAPLSQSTTGIHVTRHGKALYYVGSYQKQNHSDLVLFGGYDTSAPRFAQASFLQYTKDFKIFVGDQKTPSSDDWDVVRCADGGMFKDPSFRFETRVRGADGRTTKNKYYWKKTSDRDLGASKMSPRDYKLVDESSDEVVAVYIEHHLGSGDGGRMLRFRQPLNERVQIAALMVLLALLEKYRRYMRHVARAFPSTNSY